MASSTDTILLVFAIIGAIYVAKVLFVWLLNFYKFFLRCEYNFAARYASKKHKSSWVAITGATGSLGYSYSKQFASRGFNILMIARNESKANTAMENLKKEYPNVETAFMQCDLNKFASKEERDRIATELETILASKDIAILVNNGGVEIDSEKFAETELERNVSMMVINMFPPLVLAQLLIPYFLKRDAKSLVVNVGSGLANIYMPGFGVYAGTKKFMDLWTVCASKEYENSNIDFIVTHPGAMSSPMTQMDTNALMGVIETDTYAKHSMKHFGKSRKNTGYWYHALFFNMLMLLPFEVQLFFGYKVMRPMFLGMMNK